MTLDPTAVDVQTADFQITPGTGVTAQLLGFIPRAVTVKNPSSSPVFLQEIDYWAPAFANVTKKWISAPGQLAGRQVHYRADTLPAGTVALQPAVTETISITYTTEDLPERHESFSPGSTVNTIPPPITLIGQSQSGNAQLTVNVPAGVQALLIASDGTADITALTVVETAGLDTITLLPQTALPQGTALIVPWLDWPTAVAAQRSFTVFWQLPAGAKFHIYGLFYPAYGDSWGARPSGASRSVVLATDQPAIPITIGAAVDVSDRATRQAGIVTDDFGTQDTLSASGSATAPAQFGAIVTLSGLTALATYLVDVTVGYGSTADIFNNFQLIQTGTAIGICPANPVANGNRLTTRWRVTLTGSNTSLIVRAAVAGAAGSVYQATIQATQVS